MWPEVWCEWTPVPCLPAVKAGPPPTPPAASAPRSPRYTERQQLLAAQTRRLLCEGRKGNESFQAGKELTRALSAWPGAKCDLRTPPSPILLASCDLHP